MVVGAPEQRGWQDNAQRLCGFQIQDQLELRGLLDRQVGHSLAFKNLIDKARGAAEDVGNAGAIREQTAGDDGLA